MCRTCVEWLSVRATGASGSCAQHVSGCQPVGDEEPRRLAKALSRRTTGGDSDTDRDTCRHKVWAAHSRRERWRGPSEGREAGRGGENEAERAEMCGLWCGERRGSLVASQGR